jgi:hypothetical protein
MNNKYLLFSKVYSLLGIALLLNYSSLKASDYRGAEMSYSCLGTDLQGNNQYRIQLTLYRDCSGISMGNVQNYQLTDCNGNNSSYTMSLDSAREITTICLAEASNTNCAMGNSWAGVEAYIYADTLTLNTSCNSWILSWTGNTRNSMITNGAAGQSIYIEAHLDNSTGLCNNSPVFSHYPTTTICTGQESILSFAATDVDGDSLFYELICPMSTGPNNPITITPSCTQPFVTSPSNGLVFNSSNGAFKLTPSSPQTVVVAVRVYEVRNGDTIGTTMRDFQISVSANCSNSQPTSTYNPINPFLSNTVTVCSCDTISYVVSFTDPNGDSLTVDVVNTNIGEVFGSANVTLFAFYPVIGQYNQMDLFVQIRTCGLSVGRRSYTLAVTDNTCPFPQPLILPFELEIIGAEIVAPATELCAGAAQNIPLQANTYNLGGLYNWSQVSGPAVTFNNDSIANPIMSVPAGTTPGQQIVIELEYWSPPDPVTGTFCITTDQFSFDFGNPDLELDIVASDSTLCQNGQNNIVNFTTLAGAEADTSAGSYSWSANPASALTNLSSSTINNPVASLSGNPGDSVTYFLDYSFGVCSARDTIGLVFNRGIPSSFAALASICSGDSVEIGTALVDYSTGDTLNNYTVAWDAGVGISNLDSAETTVWPLSTITYPLSIIYDGCLLRDSVLVTVNTNLPAPALSCGTTANNSTDILFDWGNIAGATGWEYSLDTGSSWMSLALAEDSLLLTGLAYEECAFIQVRATGGSGACSQNAANSFSCCTYCNDLPQLSIVQQSDITCNGFADGVIQILATGGDLGPNYTFNLYDTSGTLVDGPVSVLDTATFAGLPIGGYYASVTDAFQCPSISDTIYLSEPLPLSIVMFATADTCNNNNGTVYQSLIGGTLPYTYQWSNGQTSGAIINLNAGTYSLTATDSKGCSIVDSAVVPLDIIAPTLSVSFTNPLCFGEASGSATVTANGGNSPYFYTWSNGSNAFTINNLVEANYSVTVTDAYGCTSTAGPLQLTAPTALSSSLLGVDPIGGLNNGSIDLMVSGGTAPYSYLWNNGAQTQDLNNLSGGSYDVLITDANGCALRDSISLNLINDLTTVNEANLLEILPNPNNGQFIIQLQLNERSMQLEIADASGRQLRYWEINNQTPTQISVDMSQDAAGIYFLRLSNKNGLIQSQKVSIQP